VYSAAFSPDGLKIVSASEDTTVRVWSVASGTCEQTMTGHTGLVLSAAFSPEGRQIVSGSVDKTVRVWDAATGDCEQTMEGHTSTVTSAAFSPEGRQIVSGSDHGTVRRYYGTVREESDRSLVAQKSTDARSSSGGTLNQQLLKTAQEHSSRGAGRTWSLGVPELHVRARVPTPGAVGNGAPAGVGKGKGKGRTAPEPLRAPEPELEQAEAPLCGEPEPLGRGGLALYKIFVETSDGKVITVDVQGGDTVAAVKVQLEALEGIPLGQQRLLFAGRQLKDGETLAGCYVQAGSTLQRQEWRCQCSTCGLVLAKTGYSKSQLSKAGSKRRCKTCVRLALGHRY
jgi:hypothetical protein